MITYQLEVYTGSVDNASTAANVYVIISAEDGNTGRRALKRSLNNKMKFGIGQVHLTGITLTLHTVYTFYACMQLFLNIIFTRSIHMRVHLQHLCTFRVSHSQY